MTCRTRQVFTPPSLWRALRAVLPKWGCGLLLLWAQTSWAYLPSAKTILSRLTQNSGNGFYVIEQEVQFRSLAEPISIKEKWVVGHGEWMHLTATGTDVGQKNKYRMDILYKDGKRYAPDDNGKIRVSDVGAEFLEKFFHYRTGTSLMDALIRARILPANAQQSRPPVRSLEKLNYSPEPFVRLGRSGGAITWIFGQTMPAQRNAATPPTLWIEQDAFLLRKLRLASQTEMTAQNHESFSKGLKFPRERWITWDHHAVSIQARSVQSLSSSAASKLLSPASMSQLARQAELPDDPQVKEFYSRFR